MPSSPDTTSDPFVDTTSKFTAINSTNREALREEHAQNFENYFIDDTIVREPYVEPPPKVKKTRGKKRAADVSETPNTNAGPLKKVKIPTRKMSSSSAEGDITPEDTQVRRSGRSNAGQKRKAGEIATEQLITPESPLAKESKPSTTTTSKGKEKAADMDPVTPPKRPTSNTRTLRAERKSAKTRIPSAGPSKTAAVDPAKDSDVEPKAAKPDLSDVEESAVRSSRASSKPATVKKEVKNAVPSDYKGTATSMGTTAEQPAGAPLSQPWACANRACSSGMTWFHRESRGSDGFGRKTISQFFGRNKKETHRIDGDVWHTYCRKDYQRMYYKAVRAEGGEYKWHMDNLKQQFVRLKLWRPEATFTIGLSKKMNEKSSEWYRILRKHKGDKDAAQEEFNNHKTYGIKEPKVSKRGGNPKAPLPEDAFPVDFVDEFQSRACKSDVDYEGIEDIMEYLQKLYDNETLVHMPPIEFLISDIEKGETIRDPKQNYQFWVDEMENEQSFEDDAEAGAAQAEEESQDDEDVHAAQSEKRQDSKDVKVESSASEDEGSEIRVAAPLGHDPKAGYSGRLQDSVAKRAATTTEPNYDGDEGNDAASEDEQSDADDITVSQPRNAEYSTCTIVNSIEQSAPAPLPLYTPPKPISKKPFKLTPVDPGRCERLSTTLGSKPGNGRTPPVNRATKK